MSDLTKMYRVVFYVKDLNKNTPTIKDVTDQLENLRYPEFVKVAEVLETNIGPWSDDHPLNFTTADKYKYASYFPELDARDNDDIWLKQEHQRVRSIMMQQIQKNSDLKSENEELKRKIAGLEKVQELVKNIKEATK